MAIDLCDLANILDKIVLSKHWKYLFRTLRFQHFLGGKIPDPPSGSPNRRSCDLSVVEKYPHLAYSKGWTV